jgi:hypothetical protein
MNETELKNKLKAKKTMSIEEIVRKDIASNQPGISVGQGFGALKQFKDNGAQFFRFGNTLFIVTNESTDSVIYHSINADPPKTYVYNEVHFFAKLHLDGKKEAVTYFSNPKTLKFANKYKLPIQTISKSNDPSQGSMMIVSNLVGGY